jgi:hypothetical protein
MAFPLTVVGKLWRTIGCISARSTLGWDSIIASVLFIFCFDSLERNGELENGEE